MLCSGCGADKPAEQFPLSSYTKQDGTRSRAQPCRSCRANYAKQNYLREYHLGRKYGITPADFEALSVQQGGVCAICGHSPDSRGLFVDHDHERGFVRGLLCSKCNSLLGLADESPDVLLASIEYLKRGPVVQSRDTLRRKRGRYRGEPRPRRVPDESGCLLCTKCKRRLPMDEFYRSMSSRIGRQSHCKECTNKRKRTWWANRKLVPGTKLLVLS
jgi:hypothetical protein